MPSVTINDLLQRLELAQECIEDQRRRIEGLEGRLAIMAAPVAPGASGMSRGDLLKIGAVGAIGGVSVLKGMTAAGGAGKEGQTAFQSRTSTPTVSVKNTSTGNAIAAAAKFGTTVDASQTSRSRNAVAVRGTLDSSPPGAGSSGLVGSVTDENATFGTGVSGTHAGAGVGVSGHSALGVAISGTSDSTNDNAVAIHGKLSAGSPGSASSAILGTVKSTGGNGTGVTGIHGGSGVGVEGQSSGGIGVSGTSASTADSAAAVQGTITSASPGDFSAGVYGQNNGTSVFGYGVCGRHSGSGCGVYGTTDNGDGVGVYGDAGISGVGIGVNGYSGKGAGVRGVSDTSTGVEGGSSDGHGVSGGSDTAYGVYGESTFGAGVYGSIVKKDQAGVVGTTSDKSGNWGVYAYGNIGASGTKSAVIPAADGNGHVTLYCMESPECWFEDFGSEMLRDGYAQVHIDPEFAHTIQTDDYFVFLTPEGETRGLFVAEKHSAGFEVREAGGHTTARFSFRIVGRRRHVAAPRLNRTSVPKLAR